MAQTLSALGEHFRRYVRIGVDTAEPRQRRSHEIVNFVGLAAVISNTSFAIVFAWLGFRAYSPMISIVLLFSLVYLATPLVHRFGNLAAGTYLWAAALVGNPAYAAIAGADAGFQYFLLAPPALLVMVLGSRRLVLISLYFAALLVGFVLVELFFPRKTELVSLSPLLTQIIFLMAVCASASFNLIGALYTFRRAEAFQEAFEAEHERSERLLLNLVPAAIAERLKIRPDEIIAETLPAVTILFADIVGFTQRASHMPPVALVGFLNRIFMDFDRLAERLGLEKIKTIGDAYMVAGGMPEQNAAHAGAVADMALGMVEILKTVSDEMGETIAVRIGIHSGPAVAGVIGESKPLYDVWGDTVNIAARMESHGEPGRVQVSADARAAIGEGHEFAERGLVKIKGKGEMATFWLVGRKD